MKTLIVEQKALGMTSMAALFTRYGLCDVVETGTAAIRFYEAALRCPLPYDLICLDLSNPALNEADLLGALRHPIAVNVATPRFMALFDPADARIAICEYLYDACLKKPLQKPDLLAALHRIGLLEDATRFAMALD